MSLGGHSLRGRNCCKSAYISHYTDRPHVKALGTHQRQARGHRYVTLTAWSMSEKDQKFKAYRGCRSSRRPPWAPERVLESKLQYEERAWRELSCAVVAYVKKTLASVSSTTTREFRKRTWFLEDKAHTVVLGGPRTHSLRSLGWHQTCDPPASTPKWLVVGLAWQD